MGHLHRRLHQIHPAGAAAHVLSLVCERQDSGREGSLAVPGGQPQESPRTAAASPGFPSHWLADLNCTLPDVPQASSEASVPCREPMPANPQHVRPTLYFQPLPQQQHQPGCSRSQARSPVWCRVSYAGRMARPDLHAVRLQEGRCWHYHMAINGARRRQQ